jgi:hypothetical protein
MKTLLLAAGIGSQAGVAVVLIGAWVLSAHFSSDVLFIAPNAPEAVEMERMIWEEGDPVVPIYGIPADEKQRILFADEGKIVRPEEDSNLILYRVSKEQGDNPLQEKTLWFFARWAATGLGVAAAISFAGLALIRRSGTAK